MLGAGFGEGLEPALQGLFSRKADAGESGRLFAFIYMCSMLGDITGGPLMSALMSIGRSASNPSGGYCFLASSVCYAVTLTNLKIGLTLLDSLRIDSLCRS